LSPRGFVAVFMMAQAGLLFTRTTSQVCIKSSVRIVSFCFIPGCWENLSLFRRNRTGKSAGKEGKMKRTFSIEWRDDYGEDWMSKENLEACLFSKTCTMNVQVKVVEMENQQPDSADEVIDGLCTGCQKALSDCGCLFSVARR